MLSIGALLFISTAFITVKASGALVPMCFVALAVSCCLLGAIRYLRIRTAVILAFIPVLAFAWVQFYKVLFVPNTEYKGFIAGTVTEINAYNGSKSMTVSVDQTDTGMKHGSGVRVYVSLYSKYAFGDTVMCEGTFTPVETPETLARGIDYEFSGKTTSRGQNLGAVYKLRRWLISFCDDNFANAAGFIKAVTVAERSDLSASDTAIFARAGASHVLAVSGMHLSVMVMLLYTLFKKLVKNRFISSVFGILCVCCFCLISGSPYSALRAGLMLCIMFTGVALSAKADSFTSLFAAGALIILFDPYAASSLSLQLSFLSTLGLICAANAVRPRADASYLRSKLRELTLTPLVTTLAVILFTLPVTLAAFGKFSLLSPVSTALSMILFPPMLLTAYLSFALSAILPFAANIFTAIPKFLASVFISCVDGIASLPIASATFLPALVPVICIACAVFALLLLVVKKDKRIRVFAVSLAVMPVLLISAVALPFFTRTETLCYRDTLGGYGCAAGGGNDCVFLASGSCTSAVDAVYKAGYCSCDSLAVVSLSSDTPRLIEYFARVYGTRTVYLPKPAEDEDTKKYDNAVAACKGFGCEYVPYKAISLVTGGMELTISAGEVAAVTAEHKILIAHGYKYAGEHVYDKIVLPRLYYPKPSGEFDPLADYYTASPAELKRNLISFESGEYMTVIP